MGKAPSCPLLDVSCGSIEVGVSGTNSCILVGKFLIFVRIHLKAARVVCTPLDRLNILAGMLVSACYMWLNSHLDPSKAKPLERNLPRALYHFFTDILFCLVGIYPKISIGRCSLSSGNLMVESDICIIHPRIILLSLHEQSHFSNFY